MRRHSLNLSKKLAIPVLFTAVLAFVSSEIVDAQTNVPILKTLYSFKGGSGNGDGIYPKAGLARDAKGNLYGTTWGGGGGLGSDTWSAGCGTVFKLSPSGKETVLYQLASGPNGPLDGCTPQSGVVLDSSGNIYGVADMTEDNGCCEGTVFQLDPSGNETILHTFVAILGGDGRIPTSTLVRDQSGNLFGTTQQGGATTDYGSIFKIDPSGNETLLYSFTGGTDGAAPYRSRLLLDPSGNLYGLANAGGNLNCDGGKTPWGCGVVFRVTPSGNETVLYAFQGGTDGIAPLGDLVQDSAGNLYGVTQSGGAHGNGVVFRVSDSGQETVLYTFHAGFDGRPMSGVVLDAAGSLYGTTTMGGAYHRGSIFKLDPSGRRTEVYSFTGGNDGGRPWGTPLLDDQGHLYGTTIDGGTGRQGTVFEIIP